MPFGARRSDSCTGRFMNYKFLNEIKTLEDIFTRIPKGMELLKSKLFPYSKKAFYGDSEKVASVLYGLKIVDSQNEGFALAEFLDGRFIDEGDGFFSFRKIGRKKDVYLIEYCLWRDFY